MTGRAHQNIQPDAISLLRACILKAEAEVIIQNHVIAALELSGRDAREARAIRARLWLTQEADRAELERLLSETRSDHF